MLDPKHIFLILVSTLLAGIAFALIFIACAAMAQERHGGGRGGGFGHGRPDDRGGGYSRPGPSGGSNVTVNKYYGGGGRQYYHERRPGYTYAPGYGWYNPSAAIGGAIGGWLWRQWAQPEPPQPVRDVAWCMNRYRSYDPYTRTYLSYEGVRMACP